MNRDFSPRRLSRSLLILFSVLLASLVLVTPALAQDDPATEGLHPGRTVTYRQTIPVNIVFVGYTRDQIDERALKGILPRGYEPIVRYPAFYGVAGRDTGLSFNFRYNLTFAPQQFTDDYFAYLASIATPGDLTLPQQWYNDNAGNVLDVTGPVAYIDGPSAEGWLLDNASRLGVRTQRAYTVFFVNWYGRDDFQFHVYTKTDDPDPDTGYNFGVERDSRKMIAWGGSHGRAWFYDLSAGPESWTENWLVDSPDVDGDGVEDYRMPPIWEYTAGGYRDPAALSTDLGLVTRFVAINQLFTTSPLYDPMVSSPGPEGQKVGQIELFEYDRDRRFNGIDFINTDYITRELAAFQPYYDWQFAVDNNTRVPLGARRALRITGDVLVRPDCWTDYGVPFAQLFCYFDRNFDDYVPAYGPQDYVSTAFLYNTTPWRLGSLDGTLGYADDNWTDGTPSYVFGFLTQPYAASGYGLSTTTIHEIGHHHGLSHPHDGYDSELGVDYGPASDLFFAWSGDESATIMSYIDLNFSYGTFDYDNMGRYQFAGYLNWANHLLDDIRNHPGAAGVDDLVRQGRRQARLAEEAFNAWAYTDAATYARQSYEAIGQAAEQLGIPTARAEALRLKPNPNVPRVIDPIRHEDH
jgi:hypothetical protein